MFTLKKIGGGGVDLYVPKYVYKIYTTYTTAIQTDKFYFLYVS